MNHDDAPFLGSAMWGEWVGECELTSQYTCDDLTELYGEAGWLNIHEVNSNHVCAETDNLQANHFVDPGMMKIPGDDVLDDIGASCRPMMYLSDGTRRRR